MGKRLVWVQRFVTISLLIYLFAFHIELEAIRRVLSRVNPLWLALAYAFLSISVVVSVFRWRSILLYDDIHVPVSTLVSLYYIGHFYNLTLPGSLGGDAIKAYKTAAQGEETGTLAASVPMERLSGLLALVVMMFVGIVVAPISLGLRATLLVTALGIVAVAGVGATDFGRRIGEYVASSAWITNRGWSRSVLDVVSSVRNLRDPGYVGVVVGYSLAYFLVSLLTLHSLGRAFDVVLPFGFLIAVIPIVRLSNQLPISVGGLGVRESLFVFFFAMVGVESSVAIFIGLSNYLLQLINGIIGAVLEIYGGAFMNRADG